MNAFNSQKLELLKCDYCYLCSVALTASIFALIIIKGDYKGELDIFSG